ncbi:O-antigen ligase family protein [Vibrio mangrovi]|uniref:O-Antigen ligase n=1 Tax=Vibrio mangrovi TaxID=474394 RepID=A0A1Y6IWD2_9VIBR|nr:O-antigen ligase family protein [Vibrio mangrovi]MDW6003089.1 O-antigen ligase family protein [Vibrio mangrovi]SMS01331.1 O-Antigen ligase [Vibrio mangrovi]
MRFRKNTLYSLLISSNLLFLTLSNGLFKRPILTLYLLIFLMLSLRPTVIKQVFTLCRRCYPLMVVFLWCAMTAQWSPWPKVTYYELFWQLVLFLYVTLFVIRFYELNSRRVIYYSFCVWLFLTYLLVAKNDLLAGRLLEISGAFANKNNLGPIISVFLFFYVYSVCQWNLLRVGMLLATFLLLLATLSKTSIALSVFVALLAWIIFSWDKLLVHRFRRLYYGSGRVIGLVLSGMLVLTLMFYYRDMVDWLLTHVREEWLTGRGQLWLVMLNQSYEKLFLGVGYSAVWGLGDNNLIQETELAKYAPEWVEKLAASDGGYVDMLISIGAVGTALFVYTICDFFMTFYSSLQLQKNIELTKLCFCVGTFVVLNNVTETKFLLGSGFSWFCFLFCYVLLKYITGKEVVLKTTVLKTTVLKATVMKNTV